MTHIPSGNIKRFLSAAALAMAIPLTVAAHPDDRGADGHGAMEGHGMHGPQGGEMSHHGMMGGMLPRHLRGLNLTEAQQDKVFDIMHAQAPGMRDKEKALHKAQAALRQLTATADYSEGKARALADEIGKLTFDVTLARSKGDRQIYEILTPEQRAQLAEMKPGPDGRHRHGPRGGEGRQPPRPN